MATTPPDLPGTEVRLVKERYADSEGITPMNNPVCCAPPETVCPALHHVSNVDNKGTRYGISVDSRPRCGLDLKRAFGVVRKEEGHAAVISMLPTADATAVIPRLTVSRIRDRGILL
jgi:hypothetical protein